MFQRRYVLRGAVLLLATLSLVTLPGLGSALPLHPTARHSTVRFEGEISEIATTHWVVREELVLVHDRTVIIENEGAAEPGAWVIVTATRAEDGALWADWIRVERAAGEWRNLTEFTALIETSGDESWIVGSVEVCITPDTTISGRPKAGLPAHVRAEWQDECWQALEISVYRSMAEGQEVEFEGIVQAIGPSLWVVGGLAVAVDEATTIVGEPAIGMTAEVSAVLETSGRLWGELIRVLPLVDESRAEFGGIIREIHVEGKGQVWTVLRLDPGNPPAEQKITVGEDCLVDQSRALAAAGSWVDVVAHVGEHDELLAQHVRVERTASTRIVGTLTAVPALPPAWWQVDDQCVFVPSLTSVPSSPVAGMIVQVEGLRLGNGCIWALQISLP
jgi:hypothetical protein